MTELLNQPGATVALVGATDDPAKYGNVIFKNLTSKGITVYPVNPRRDTVEGVTAYHRLADLPEQPTIINVVVDPRQGEGIVREVARLGWDNVWFQPGAESAAARLAGEETGVTVLDDACTMVVARPRSA